MTPSEQQNQPESGKAKPRKFRARTLGAQLIRRLTKPLKSLAKRLHMPWSHRNLSQVELSLSLAQNQMEQGNLDWACTALDLALRQYPRDPRLLLLAAQAHTRNEDFAFAAMLWRGVAERFAVRYKSEEKHDHALCLRKSGAYEEARALYRQLDQERRDMHWGLTGQAWIAQNTGQWEEAAELWRRCIARFNDRKIDIWQDHLHHAQFKADSFLIPFKVSKKPAGQAYLRQTQNDSDALPGALQFKTILVVTYGRSGSTLLQGLLNGINGVLVRGENNNVFRHFFEAYRALNEVSRNKEPLLDPTSPWFGFNAIDRNALLVGLREQAREILLADQRGNTAIDCIGFKEIRYPELGDQLGEYLDFLVQLFDKTAIIFLTRDHDQVANSGWWQDKDPAQVKADLTAFEQRCKAFASDRRDCFSLCYADMVGQTETLKALYDFLGAPYDTKAVELALATPHSYAPSTDQNKELFRSF